MTCLSSKIVSTRKPHKCCGCMRTFPPKTRMEYTVSVDGGDFSTAYFCETCQQILSDMDPFDYEDGIREGELIDNYPEMFSENEED